MKHKLIVIFVFIFSSSCQFTGQNKMSKEQISSFHKSIVTIDSHTDTPMNFIRDDFDFAKRHDPFTTGSKIDIPRMDEGGLDGIFLAVFIGQQERTVQGNLMAKRKAYQIFDSIHAVCNRNSDKLEIATDAHDIGRICEKEKHAVYIGMENAYPIGNDISLIDTFYNLGARYITLCHTLNNDVCDSSTDPNGAEYSGLSDFGVEVVKRMNKLGVMVDVSHASDETFYDVMEISDKPVIASHSCARAICNNPRNMDDKMLKLLAEKGGLIQMCILSAYVETPLPNPLRDSAKNAVRTKHGNYYELDDVGKQAFIKGWYAVDQKFPAVLADVKKMVDHIDHIVQVAGIDHVGIGSDFDGGGGLKDCFDVSELSNITAELLARDYSSEDIQKIWGGNLLRVMEKQ